MHSVPLVSYMPSNLLIGYTFRLRSLVLIVTKILLPMFHSMHSLISVSYISRLLMHKNDNSTSKLRFTLTDYTNLGILGVEIHSYFNIHRICNVFSFFFLIKAISAFF